MFQEKVRPLIERELLAAPNEREHVLIPCLQSFPKPCLGLLPVSCPRGFEAPGAIAVPVPHPPETTAPVQGRRDAFSVVPFTTSCLNEARKAASSDRKNRMFRPHHAEMGNLPPLNPSIHGLRTHPKKPRSLLHRQRQLLSRHIAACEKR